MSVRVTVGSTAAASLAGLQSSSGRLQDLQEKLSTGRQISRPSDDPSGAVRALQLRGDLKRNAQFTRNTTDAVGWLSTADSAYGQITDLVQRARTLTVQGLNSGASTGQSNEAIAEEIDSIRTAAIKLANTTYNNRPIFGGTTAGGTSYDSNGVYQGDSGTVQRAIGDKNTIQINQTGPDAFGAVTATTPPATGTAGDAASNLFTLLDQISASLKGDATVTSAGTTYAVAPLDTGDYLSKLDDAMHRLGSARSASGAAYQRALTAQSAQATDKVALKTAKSSIEDIDLAEVAVQTNTANVVYQAALQTTANIRQISLMDFLR